jgi:Uma2 family endonuclease
MGIPKLHRGYTVEEYLRIERAAEERHEYVDGRIRLMAGESGEHGDITVNLCSQVAFQLKGTPCRARIKDTKVRSGPDLTAGETQRVLFSYPELVVICGEPQYHDEFRDIVLNPTVIVEVLSPSTEAFDRGEKCTRYQTWNATLRDYLLVSQDQPLIEHFHRRTKDWSFQRYSGLDAELRIPSINCTLKLIDVYDRVVFADDVAKTEPRPARKKKSRP